MRVARNRHGATVAVRSTIKIAVGVAAADASRVVSTRGGYGTARNVDDTAFALVTAADACGVGATLGDDFATGNSDLATVAVIVTTGSITAANAGAAFIRYVSRAAFGSDLAARDRHLAAVALLAAADTGGIGSASCLDGTAVNRNSAAIAVLSAADAGTVPTSRCFDFVVERISADGDVTARGLVATADARAVTSALCGYVGI